MFLESTVKENESPSVTKVKYNNRSTARIIAVRSWMIRIFLRVIRMLKLFSIKRVIAGSLSQISLLWSFFLEGISTGIKVCHGPLAGMSVFENTFPYR